MLSFSAGKEESAEDDHRGLLAGRKCVPYPTKGWRLVLTKTGLGSWADEMEDMPLPCE